jgi:hypothetical protein
MILESKPPRKSRGFLQRLNPWSSKEHTVVDFHRRNQAFLSRMDRQQSSSPSQATLKSFSPRQQMRRYAKRRCLACSIAYSDLCVFRDSPPGPPPSRGTHRRLPSIENDEWEEDAKSTGSTGSGLKIHPSRSRDESVSSAVSSRSRFVGRSYLIAMF